MQERRVSKGEVTKAVVLASIGSFVELYDLLIGTVAAGVVFPKLFFPSSIDPTLSILFSLMVGIFVTVLFRPIGALIFGHIGDKLGRKSGLVWDLIIVGVGTLIVGLAPPYSVAGYLSLVMVILGRMLVGIGIGGELGGAFTLIMEQAYAAGSRWRALWTSMPYVAWGIAAIVAPGILTGLSVLYGNAFIDFGWRVAFYIGAAVVVIAIVLRYLLLESALFEEARRTVGAARAPAIEAFKYWKYILGIALAYAVGPMTYYIFSSYITIFATNVAGFSRDLALLALTISGIPNTIGMVVAASLGDLWGRRRTVMTFVVLSVIASVAWPLLILTKQFPLLVLANSFLGFATGAIVGPMGALATEHFPTRYRYTGSGFGIQLGAVIGTIGTLIVAGITRAELWWAIPTITAIYALISISVLTFILKETRHEKLTH